MKEYGASIIFGIVILMLFLMPRGFTLPGVPAFAAGSVAREFTPGRMIFGGDVMLGREVERIMGEHGAGYPFEGIKTFIRSADIAFANFEAAVPKGHSATPNHDLTLSVDPRYMETLREAGFDGLSLANNHSYDFGSAGLSNTRRVCEYAGLLCFGDPNRIGEVGSTIVSAGTTRVGVLAIHAVIAYPDENDIRDAIDWLRDKSDIQIAYIHWGEEYETKHNRMQERLAHELIDLGFDAVIGHHPHVVEDIEMYDGKPIFYSLGNLIFDQYLSDETEEGLIVRVDIDRDMVMYTLVPVSSLRTPSQPQLMDVDGRDAYMDALFARSNGVEAFRSGGALVVPR